MSSTGQGQKAANPGIGCPQRTRRGMTGSCGHLMIQQPRGQSALMARSLVKKCFVGWGGGQLTSKTNPFSSSCHRVAFVDHFPDQRRPGWPHRSCAACKPHGSLSCQKAAHGASRQSESSRWPESSKDWPRSVVGDHPQAWKLCKDI